MRICPYCHRPVGPGHHCLDRIMGEMLLSSADFLPQRSQSIVTAEQLTARWFETQPVRELALEFGAAD